MTDKQWEPLTTPEAVVEAVKAGRHVEFTACGCDYDAHRDGWVEAQFRALDRPWEMLSTGGRYRALIAPAQPHSCPNCLGVDPASCVFAPAQPAADDLCGGAVEPARGGWRAIETAPKDTPILVGPTKRMGVCVARLTDRDGWETETPSYWVGIYTPTHWMPLPEPPND